MDFSELSVIDWFVASVTSCNGCSVVAVINSNYLSVV